MEKKEATTSGNEAKTIEMKPVTSKDEQKKPSYEELMNVASQLNQQCQMLARQKAELENRLQQTAGIEARLHYLFKVLEFRSAFNDPDYIISVCDEIKDLMTIVEEQPKEEAEK